MLRSVAALLNPHRKDTGIRSWWQLHGLVALLVSIALACAFAFGWIGGYHAGYTAQYFRQHYRAPVLVPAARSTVPLLPGTNALPTQGSLQLSLFPAVADQGPMGTCAAWSTAEVLDYEYRVSHPGHPRLRFSVRWLYDHYSLRYQAGQDNGSWPDQNVEIGPSEGFAQFRTFPYPPFLVPGADVYPPQAVANAATHRIQVGVETLTNAQGGGQGAVDAIKAAILQNHPALFAIPVYPTFDNATSTSGLIGLPSAGSSSRGGHELVGIAFDDSKIMPDGSTGAVEIQNSWSTRWGLHGQGWLAYTYIREYAFGIKTLHLGGLTAGYIPPGSIFGLTNINSVISSAYWYENSLVAGNPAVEDSDYGLGYAVHELVHLPGPRSFTYWLVQSGYIFGSGWYETFRAENGGHLAFLHLVGLQWVAGRTTFHGGDSIGYSGWPSSYTYSNGSCNDEFSCRRDAHLCLVLDQAGADWMYHVATYVPPPRPKPHFPTHAWTAWTRKHHKHPIPHTYRGHLTTIAKSWWKSSAHRLYGAPRTLEHYDRRYHVMEEWFVRGKAVSWPSHPRWHVKWVRA